MAIEKTERKLALDASKWSVNRLKVDPQLPGFLDNRVEEALCIESWLKPPWTEAELDPLKPHISHHGGCPSHTPELMWDVEMKA